MATPQNYAEQQFLDAFGQRAFDALKGRQAQERQAIAQRTTPAARTNPAVTDAVVRAAQRVIATPLPALPRGRGMTYDPDKPYIGKLADPWDFTDPLTAAQVKALIVQDPAAFIDDKPIQMAPTARATDWDVQIVYTKPAKPVCACGVEHPGEPCSRRFMANLRAGSKDEQLDFCPVGCTWACEHRGEDRSAAGTMQEVDRDGRITGRTMPCTCDLCTAMSVPPPPPVRRRIYSGRTVDPQTIGGIVRADPYDLVPNTAPPPPSVPAGMIIHPYTGMDPAAPASGSPPPSGSLSRRLTMWVDDPIRTMPFFQRADPWAYVLDISGQPAPPPAPGLPAARRSVADRLALLSDFQVLQGMSAAEALRKLREDRRDKS